MGRCLGGSCPGGSCPSTRRFEVYLLFGMLKDNSWINFVFKFLFQMNSELSVTILEFGLYVIQRTQMY